MSLAGVDTGELSIWPAPAKLNLFLRITARRSDGYHELQTAFQFLDFHDEISIRVRTDGQIHRLKGLEGLPEEQDMVMRAAALLQAQTRCRLGADLMVDKRIPVGGGLGGGSSDAATVLTALNRLWETGLSRTDLAGLGGQLGADVPVFVAGQSAWAEGIGDRLTPMDFPCPWYLVVHPGVAVLTQEIFSDPELTRNSRPIKITSFLSHGDRNDCLTVVRRKYAEVGLALDWLGQYGDARLTGTGACVFSAFETCDEAGRALDRLPAKWRGFVARGLNRSPLLQMG